VPLAMVLPGGLVGISLDEPFSRQLGALFVV